MVAYSIGTGLRCLSVVMKGKGPAFRENYEVKKK